MQNNRRDFGHQISDNTVLGEWFEPMTRALEKVRFSDKRFRTLPMATFILLGCLRQIQDAVSLRAYIQSLFHLDATQTLPPLARSTWSDALASDTRCEILKAALLELTKMAQLELPDRLASVKGLGTRPVQASDASYVAESSHYYPRYPAQDGNDNQKGHMMLSHYDLRCGIPLSATTQTQSLGEMKVYKRDDLSANQWLCNHHAIHVVDRAFIDIRYWDQRLDQYAATVITRMKSSMVATLINERELDLEATEQGVLYDHEVTLIKSKKIWRLIGYRSPEGIEYEYLSNDLKLAPEVIAFLYHRRWDKEKYYDNFKNDLAGTKAWGKSPVAIEQQALMGIISVLLTRLFLQRRQLDLELDKPDSTQDKKHQNKQKEFKRLRAKSVLDKHDYRALWTHLSKITRQVWRFLKNCFLQKPRLAFYQRQLRPLLLRYL